MTEGQNGSSSETPENHKNDLSNCVKSRLPKDMKLKNGQLFGPFADPLQWLAIKCTDTSAFNLNTIDRKSVDLFSKIDVARHSKEQNIEIILQNGQFYFKSTSSIDASSSKLLAWFNDDLNSRLPMASMATLNGSKRYFCGLCNQVFLYPNPVVIHILFECPKRHDILIPYMRQATAGINNGNGTAISKSAVISTSSSSSATTAATATVTVTTKKRGFDIDSLVNDDKFNDESVKKSRSADNNLHSINLNDHNIHASEPYLNSTVINRSTVSPPSPASQPSAFRKFDKPARHLINLPSHVHSQHHLTHQQHQINTHFDFASLQSLYTASRGLNCESLASSLFPGHPSFVPGLTGPLLSPPPPPGPAPSPSSHNLLGAAAMTTSPPTSSTSPSSSSQSGAITAAAATTGGSPNNNNSSKSMIPPSLLPFLPPSLAALSFPQTNWCAKCNATFRMTSDLVYHMRSHHKKEITADPLKKKREEKLRCNICDESFRERHHLTRHMTSHQ